MPTITVDKEDFYKALGQSFTTQEFDELCFQYGIELDEDTSESERPIVDGVMESPQLKIEIPANRYDMLCFEGIVRALNVFRGKQGLPNYRKVRPAKLERIIVHQETSRIRQYVSGAILRNITFNKDTYDSFIALQDKLHMNLCRSRSLVSIGTHNYDALVGPFTYEALPPEDIRFAPLNQDKKMDAKELMFFYEHDKHLGRFLHIIRDSPVYPVIYDSNRTVASLPPIINGNHSRITLDTRNVFIEITATDKTKVEIVANILVAMFSQYCDEPFTIEPIEIISPHNNESREAPDLQDFNFSPEISYLNSCTGLDLDASEICDLLRKMSYRAVPNGDLINVTVPCTRADVLHACDIMEDLAIAYGYDNLEVTFPKSATIAKPSALNKLSDIVRTECAMASWTEVMPLILCSHDESFAFLRKKDGGQSIKLANPKTLEYQVVRTSLLSGILKTIRENRKQALPIMVFEVSDIAFKDENRERKTRNQRNWAAVYCGKSSGFETVHGLLDRVMAMLSTPSTDANAKALGYWIEQFEDPTFFPGRAASIHLRTPDGQEQKIGAFGILHPEVLRSFDVPYPCSSLELNLEYFL